MNRAAARSLLSRSWRSDQTVIVLPQAGGRRRSNVGALPARPLRLNSLPGRHLFSTPIVPEPADSLLGQAGIADEPGNLFLGQIYRSRSGFHFTIRILLGNPRTLLRQEARSRARAQ